MSVLRSVRSAMAQVTSSVLMIRPLAFGFDVETCKDNVYQREDKSLDALTTAVKGREEFDSFVGCLRGHGVSVKVVEDSTEAPGACFPNNWFSCHADERMVVVYPMMAKSRRVEIRWDVIKEITQSNNWEVLDLSHYVREDKFLEGTGSLVLDRVNKIAYACLSQRTDQELVDVFCTKLGYKPVMFNAASVVNGKTYPVYHTNVMMSVGTTVAVVCLDVIQDPTEKEAVMRMLESSGKEVLAITEEQMNKFAGNVLEVCNQQGESIMVMSSQAYGSLDTKQLQKLQQYSSVLHSPIPVIEANGGGSARCMIAELHDK